MAASILAAKLRPQKLQNTVHEFRLASKITCPLPKRKLVYPGSAPKADAQAAMDFASRDALILEHLPMVRGIAAYMHLTLPASVELDDVVHAGVLGLIDAATKFDSSKQVPFGPYAKYRIKGAILDSLRQLDRAPRELRRHQKRVDQCITRLTAKLNRPPLEAEVAADMRMDIKRWRTLMQKLRNADTVSSSSHVGTEDSAPPVFACRPDTRPDVVYAREHLERVLANVMEQLPERYQQVVRLYHMNDMSMIEISRLMGVNQSRVSQIRRLALNRMAAMLSEMGITSAIVFPLT
jgi:RNA polymerase sigma factor FliA